ncbi:MAG TPA: porin [Burkholderiales bacterium]|nr:porin [Burkholderiales bacterium]
MEKRKILAVKASVLAVAAAFGAPSHVAAADTSVQFYGHLDLSVDGATKGIKEGGAGQNPAPVGKVGWQTDVSSNLSYFGFRGDHDIGRGYKMVFQVETQVDVAATPGPSPVNQASQGNVDNKVLGALGSRNSFLGIAGNFGAFKLGKTDAPYKLSTARMDPFSATVGDYNSIMGNTGGDNRAEFDTRLSHAMWYESPKWGGASFSALWAPGQNRASDNSNNASGEPDCTGGGGGVTGNSSAGSNTVNPCNDGSFGDAYSVAGVYEAGPLYGILAYELHRKANRVGDEHPATVGDVGVADEAAMKVGVQYMVTPNTILNAIFERMTRKAPNAGFNERQRNGSWLALTQKITGQDDLNVGWAHAAKSPGQPGFGDSGVTTNPGSVDNASNMYTVGYKHHFDKQSNWYAVYARQANKAGGHYDLGASGHGITTDCKDALGTCFTGETLQAVSVGWMYSF